MASFNSKQYAKQLSVPPVAMFPTEFEGRVRVAYAQLVGGEQVLNTNDDVRLFVLPAGSRPLLFIVNHGAFGTGVTLDIGTSPGANTFVSGLSVAAAGRVATVPLTLAVLANDTLVHATFKSANPADDQSLEVICLYATA